MTDKRMASAIDLAFQKYPTPVGDLFVAVRHGRMKRCFSRDTAIRHLAYFLTSHAFARSGFQQRHPDTRECRPEGEVWVRGDVTVNYLLAHHRTARRLRRMLASKREAQKWLAKLDALHDRYVKEQAELQASKPAGIL